MATSSLLRAVFLAVISSRIAFGSMAQGPDALEECPSTDSSTYDYIVVGSGAGGGPVAARLAENGYSVLIVETGVDQSNNINTTSPALFLSAIDDSKIDLNYTISEYPPSFLFRGTTSGTLEHQQLEDIHNAMTNDIAGLRQTLDNLARIAGTKPLSDPSEPDHGFDGWLSTIRSAPVNFSSTDPQWEAIGTAIIGASGPVTEDMNSHFPLPYFGRGLSSSTIDSNGRRSSIRYRLDQVAANFSDKFTIMTNTLATKVLLCKSAKDIVAYGVSVAPGAKLPIAGGFTGKHKLNELMVFYYFLPDPSVIGPLFLQLSGIGDSEKLHKFGIPSIVHLPGVGTNLQDNDEVPAIWEFKQNFTDPVFWGDTFSTSAHSTSLEPDIDTWFVPVQFPGFAHGVSVLAADTPNFFTIVTLKAQSSSRGYVHLTGSHPQDLLDINKLRFQAPGGPQNIVALRERLKHWREVMNTPEIQKYSEKEVLPGANMASDEDLDNYVLEHVFSHHACCTNPIGPKDDPQAVLDGDFNVRGVQNLRVVDASSWPESPGYYPTSPTYMIAEKAARVILRDAKRE
ncbi:hypothetical protein B0H13DRAFT_2428526 [Mycena leptocephala]|nr:hypothetical protein B0H13DRAFT_2428526 [Mycena leptocephala]